MDRKIIWFNHWFSTAYHIISLMKSGCETPIYVIGSNRNPDSVVQLACDEWYTEPVDISDEDYCEFCLGFCREHKVDVFVPRRGMDMISKNSKRFVDISVRLLLDTGNGIVDVLKNKLDTYAYLENTVSECIPPYYEVYDTDSFKAAYSAITAHYERACLKLADDEGAVSFRVIDNNFENSAALRNAPGMKISYEKALQIMSSYDFGRHIIMMPYLKGTEVSADCLSTSSGRIIIPRYKSGGRIYTIKFDDKIMSYCEKIMDCCGLEMPCNIQFRYDGDQPYLLEVNTRMSGGVQLSCTGTGINIPAIALSKVLGSELVWEADNSEKKVSYIETPVRLL